MVIGPLPIENPTLLRRGLRNDPSLYRPRPDGFGRVVTNGWWRRSSDRRALRLFRLLIPLDLGQSVGVCCHGQCCASKGCVTRQKSDAGGGLPALVTSRMLGSILLGLGV